MRAKLAGGSRRGELELSLRRALFARASDLAVWGGQMSLRAISAELAAQGHRARAAVQFEVRHVHAEEDLAVKLENACSVE